MARQHLKNICLYCLTDCDQLAKQYYISDTNQKYQNIVKDIFNIEISCLKSYKNIICVKCSQDIELAVETRRKILFTQKILLERYENELKLDTESVKQEIIISDNESQNEDNKCDERLIDFDDDDDDVTVKIKAEEIKEINSNNEATNLKIETKDTHDLNSRKKRKSDNKTIEKESRMKKEIVEKKCKVKERTQKIVNNSTEKEKINLEQKTSENLEAMKENSIKLLINSNMVMFHSRKTSFGCLVCKKSFLDMKVLRQHLQTHSAVENTQRNILRIRGQTYKCVDISNLACANCLISCNDLDELKEHLTSVHNEIFNETDHLFIPYKLEAGFKCVLCQKSFQTYCKLSIHMHSHSSNNVCDTCGSSFTNLVNLRNHIKTLHTKHKCAKCNLTFPNRASKAKHLANDHNSTTNYRSHCLKCDTTFFYHYQVKEHMVEKHGAKKETGRCDFCGKELQSLSAVKIHVRSVHIGERRFQCGFCEKRFFTSCDKKRHERTHRDEKSFSCSFCEVRFKSMDSVRRHVKRQHSDTNVN